MPLAYRTTVRRRGGSGRVAERLREKLERELGFTDVILFPATGFWRTDTRADCYRWNGQGKRDGALYAFDSWFTMTELTRRGVKLHLSHSDEIEPLVGTWTPKERV